MVGHDVSWLAEARERLGWLGCGVNERVTSSSSWAFKFGLHRDVRGAWSCVWACVVRDERDKSVRWMPWRQEAMKDVARCDKLR